MVSLVLFFRKPGVTHAVLNVDTFGLVVARMPVASHYCFWHHSTAPTAVLFIWLIIHLIQLVFSVGTVFFSHKKSANSVFQSAYNSSRTTVPECQLHPTTASGSFRCHPNSKFFHSLHHIDF
jgi:hypothetical protein